MKIFEEWANRNFELPADDWQYPAGALKPIPFLDLVLGDDWHTFDLAHPLTDAGLVKFMEDWNSLLR